ncbi:MAG TPA: hypothetical protein VLL04_10875 [Rhizomicrobium sp.]|nr:hypothetical protein [Rhizomicrobium sp.]
MKKFLSGLCLAAAAAVALATPAQALCVSERDIVNTTPSKDGKLLTLKMRDGRLLVNHLQGVCSDLRFNGFVWVLRGTNDVCENQQTIRVLQSGQICLLGRFEQGKTPAPAPKAP